MSTFSLFSLLLILMRNYSVNFFPSFLAVFRVQLWKCENIIVHFHFHYLERERREVCNVSFQFSHKLSPTLTGCGLESIISFFVMFSPSRTRTHQLSSYLNNSHSLLLVASQPIWQLTFCRYQKMGQNFYSFLWLSSSHSSNRVAFLFRSFFLCFVSFISAWEFSDFDDNNHSSSSLLLLLVINGKHDFPLQLVHFPVELVCACPRRKVVHGVQLVRSRRDFTLLCQHTSRFSRDCESDCDRQDSLHCVALEWIVRDQKKKKESSQVLDTFMFVKWIWQIAFMWNYSNEQLSYQRVFARRGTYYVCLDFSEGAERVSTHQCELWMKYRN